MRVKIFLLLLVLVAPLAAGQKIFVTEFDIYRNGTIENTRVELSQGDLRVPGSENGDYSIKMISNRGEVLYESKAQISFVRFAIAGELVEKNKSEILMRLPYYKSAKKLSVNGGNKNFNSSIKLESYLCTYNGVCSAYCSGKGVDVDCTCGDGVCQDHESEELCPSDCGESSGPVDTDENQSVDGQEGSQSFWWLYVFLGCLLLVLVWLVFRSDL